MITRKKTVKSGTTIHYSVSAPGYITQEGDVLMDSDKTLNITLQQVSPDPPTPTGNWAVWTGGTISHNRTNSAHPVTEAGVYQYNTIIGGVSVAETGSPLTKSYASGNLTRLCFGGQGDALKSVEYIDGTYLTSCEGMFAECTSITTVPEFDTSNSSSFAGMFWWATEISSVPQFDTHNGRDFGGMFRGTKIKTIPIINTYNAEKMDWMFADCTELISIPNINFSGCSNFQGLFYNCSSLVSTPQFMRMSRAKTNADLYYMLYGCTSLRDIPGGGFINLGQGFTEVCNLYLSDAPNLTHTSLINVFSGLFDLNDNMNGVRTSNLVLTQEQFDSLSANEKKGVTDKGWKLVIYNPEPTPPTPTGNWIEWVGGNIGLFVSGETSYSSKPSPITKADYPENLTRISFAQKTDLTEVSYIDGTYLVDLSNSFYGCSSLVSLPVIDCSNVRYGNMFGGNLSSLTTLGGFTNLGKGFTQWVTDDGRYTLDLSQAPNLTKQSVLNLFNGLYSVEQSMFPKPTITLSQSVVDSLTTSERTIAINKGWTLLPEPTPRPEGNWAVWTGGTTSAERWYGYLTKIGDRYYSSLTSPIAKADYTGNMTRFSLYGNTSVQTVSELDTSNVTDFSTMFYDCRSLKSIPEIDTSLGETFSHMFQNCESLTSIPELDTHNGTKFISMFNGCKSLKSIPEIDTSLGETFSMMFVVCSKLTSIPQLDTHNGTDFDYMFSACYNLTTIPQLNTSSGETFNHMFYNCESLKSIPEIDTSNGTDFSDMFIGCWLLTTVAGLLGCRYSVSFADCPLTHQSAVNVLNNLGIAADSNQRITFKYLTYNTLTASEIQVATSKGWQVVSA